jgi:hypothetical protein
MQPIKFIKQKKNQFDFEVMTLVNIVSNGNELLYFFLCEYDVTHTGVTTSECDLLTFDSEEYIDVQENYKISLN